MDEAHDCTFNQESSLKMKILITYDPLTGEVEYQVREAGQVVNLDDVAYYTLAGILETVKMLHWGVWLGENTPENTEEDISNE